MRPSFFYGYFAHIISCLGIIIRCSIGGLHDEFHIARFEVSFEAFGEAFGNEGKNTLWRLQVNDVFGAVGFKNIVGFLGVVLQEAVVCCRPVFAFYVRYITLVSRIVINLFHSEGVHFKALGGEGLAAKTE